MLKLNLPEATAGSGKKPEKTDMRALVPEKRHIRQTDLPERMTEISTDVRWIWG